VDKSIVPFDRFDEDTARSWYRRWRDRIKAWLERNADSDWADILLLLPDLFMCAVGLLSDTRIPKKLRLALLSAVLYVLSPLDLFPEAILGVPGLIDDAGILIILLDVLLRALSLEPDVLAQILQDHCYGEEDFVSTIRRLLAKLKNMPGNLYETLLRLVNRWRPGGGDDTSEAVPAE